MIRDKLAGWYRAAFAKREEQPEPARPATVALTEPRRPIRLKWVFWGLAGVFLLVNILGRLVSHPAGSGERSALTDQTTPLPTKSPLEGIGDRALQDREADARKPAVDPTVLQGGMPVQQTAAQAAAEERKLRDEESLSSSTLIAVAETPEPVVRTNAAPATTPQVNAINAINAPAALTAAVAPQAAPVASTAPAATEAKDCRDSVENGVTRYVICEGAIIPAVLDNRIVGDFAGPAKAYVLYDVFSGDRKHVILPRGTVALGKAESVANQNQRRISVAFHRLILPDGRGIALEQMLALDQAGETALSGKVNRHLAQTFGTAAVIGALSGFSQFGAGSAYTGGGIDAYRQGVASSTSQQGQQILQRDLARNPTITVQEGHPIEIYISEDIRLPEYEAKK